MLQLDLRKGNDLRLTVTQTHRNVHLTWLHGVPELIVSGMFLLNPERAADAASFELDSERIRTRLHGGAGNDSELDPTVRVTKFGSGTDQLGWQFGKKRAYQPESKTVWFRLKTERGETLPSDRLRLAALDESEHLFLSRLAVAAKRDSGSGRFLIEEPVSLLRIALEVLVRSGRELIGLHPPGVGEPARFGANRR